MDKKKLMGKNNICILIGLFVIGYLLYNMNNPNNPNKPVLREHYEQPQEEHNAPIAPPTACAISTTRATLARVGTCGPIQVKAMASLIGPRMTKFVPLHAGMAMTE